jgi:hypothetical protein
MDMFVALRRSQARVDARDDRGVETVREHAGGHRARL